jgi:hypothetical protein
MSDAVILTVIEVSSLSEKTKSRISAEDRIYYTRLFFAIIAALICLGLNLSGPLGIFGFIIGIVIIVLSYFVSVYLLSVDPEAIGGHARGLIKGLGTAILLFLVIWFLVYNFVFPIYV